MKLFSSATTVALRVVCVMALSPTFAFAASKTSVPKPKSKPQPPPSLESQLIDRAFYGDLAKVEALLKAGADINAKDGQALKSAVNTGSVAVVRFLLDHKDFRNVSERATEALTGPSWIVRNAPQIIQLLLSVNPDVNRPDSEGTTPLVHYAWTGDAEVLRLLLKAGADANYKIPVGGELHPVTALCAAVMSGRPTVQAIEVLLQAGAKPDTLCYNPDYGGATTALGAAVWIGHRPMIEALLKGGADPLLKINGRDNIFTRAQNADVIYRLLDAGAVPDQEGVLHILSVAIESGDTSLSARALSTGLSPNNNGTTESPLHQAAARGQIEIMKQLIAAGANVNAQIVWNGLTPLMYAVGANNPTPARAADIVRVLLDAGAVPHINDKWGRIALDYAKLRLPPNDPAIDLLLEK